MTKSLQLSRPLFWLCALFLLAALLCSIPQQATAASSIKLVVNGRTITPDAAPYIENNRTFVPIRFAAEPIGATADWDASSKTATITKGDNVIKIVIGSKTATINGVNTTLDAAAAVRNGRTFVPIRFVSEALDATVDWDSANQTVRITTSDSSSSSQQDVFQYLGYYYSSASLEDLELFQNELTGAIHFGYQLAADGSVNRKSNFDSDQFTSAGYDVAKDAGMGTYMLVTGFSESTLTTVLSDASLRAKAINDIASIISSQNLDGVDLDFESVDESQRANLVTFVKELRTKLGNSKQISLSAMPRSAANQTWLDGYDYAGLAQYADYIILMCYNEHYSGGSPGPVASAPWVEKVIQYTINQGVSRDQIIVALGSYGYDWPDGQKGSSLTNTKARSLASQYGATIYRNGDSGCLYFNYTDSSGVAHEVWFEDSVSLGQKAALSQEYQLGGLAFWRLGFYTEQIWSSILTNTNHPNASTWQQRAPQTDNFPVKDADEEGGTTIENNGTFVPQS